MIDATFTKSIANLAAVQEFHVEDKTFTSKPVHEVKPAADQQAKTVSAFTLVGFADLLREGIDNLNPTDFIIHVSNYDRVVLVQKTTDEWGRRLELLTASPVPFEGFEFGQWLDQESFIIAVASRFAQTDDKDYVLKVASSLTSEAVTVAEDNGFSQKATIKSGMKMVETLVLKQQVSLAPYRTFPEVEQPVSAFVFRARGGESPSLMLVEADGGKWKLDALDAVARFLRVLDLKSTVIA